MVEINLFDDTFRQSECSVAWATPQHMRYVRDRTSYQGITFFTEGYVTDGTPKDVQSTYRIGWLHEPQCLHPGNYKINSLHGTNLDLILTYYEPLLGLSGFGFAPYGGVWVNQADWNVYTKTKKVSMLFGSKRQTEGHKIRHEISGDLGHADVDYYGFRGTSVNYSQETKLRVLKDYSFSIVTETCRQNNLFTEILLDCFVTGTVPIFWGCPNIGDYFNEDGILSFTHASEVRAITKSLSPDLYMSMAGAVLDNYYTAQKYAVTEDWIMYNVLLGQFL